MIYLNKILLVLDLDETLVYATKEPLDRPADFLFGEYHVYKRPGLLNFLRLINQHFSLAIWSSAGDAYVEFISETIKPEEVNFQFVWGKSRCTRRLNLDIDEYVNEKRLKKVKAKGYHLSRVLIVDDSPEKTRDNFGNAIYIAPFEGQQNDNVLERLAQYLMSIRKKDNVRAFEKRGWDQ